VESLAQPERDYYEQNHGEWDSFVEKRNHLLYLSYLIRRMTQPGIRGETQSPPDVVEEFLKCQYWGANIRFCRAQEEKPELYIEYITKVQRLPAHHRMQLIRS
jgi:hypothetical protein